MSSAADVPENLVSLRQVIGWLRPTRGAALIAQWLLAIVFLVLRNRITMLALLAGTGVALFLVTAAWLATFTFRKRLIAHWRSMGMNLGKARQVYSERFG
jgi:hypothetical protein